MKKITFLLTILLSLFFASCEDVIDLDLDTANPKLVVEASINWQKGTTGNEQIIKLTTTTGYYDETVPTVLGATVYITDSSNNRFDFIEIPNSGNYACTNFIPVINEQYNLTIIANGATYNATETMKSVAPIERIEQNNEGGFTGQNIEVKAYFMDPANEDNFYLYHYVYSNKVLASYFVSEDTYFQGNEFFSLSQDDDLKIGDEISITHSGISQQYYNYMAILINTASGGSGGPFQAPPATVRGNIINQTNFDDYALGYFSLSETDMQEYIIQ